MPEHPKVVGLSPTAKWAFVESLCYSARNLTDGRVPRAAAQRFGSGQAIRALLASGLWEEGGDCYVIHDYLDFNPSKAQVEVERDAARSRMAHARSNKRRSSGDVRPNIPRSSGNPDPVPDPLPREPERDRSPQPPAHPDAPAVYTDLASSLGVMSPPIGWAETWLKTRSLADIRAAIGVAREKGAQSTRYVDAILEKPPTPARPRSAVIVTPQSEEMAAGEIAAALAMTEQKRRFREGRPA